MIRGPGALAGALPRGACIAALLALVYVCAMLARTHVHWHYVHMCAGWDPGAYEAAQAARIASAVAVAALASWTALLLAGPPRMSGTLSRLRRALAGDLSAPTRADLAYACLAAAAAAAAAARLHLSSYGPGAC